MNALKAAVSGRIPGDIHVSSSSSRAAVRFFKTSFQFHLKSRHLFYWILLLLPTFSSFCLFFHLLHFPYFLFQLLLFPFSFTTRKKNVENTKRKDIFLNARQTPPSFVRDTITAAPLVANKW
jgi:hypothetical protein